MKLIRVIISSAGCSCQSHMSFVFTSALKFLPSYFFPRSTYIDPSRKTSEVKSSEAGLGAVLNFNYPTASQSIFHK